MSGTVTPEADRAASARTTRVDIAILGGGIAGLWLLNRLQQAGYSACLVERHSLGGVQTLASQGMIHGGIKYTLGGALTNASETIAAMPGRWEACLRGDGEIDLSGVRTLSRDYYLFSDATLTSKVTALFGSRLVEGRVTAVERDFAPAAFQDPGFKGLLYKLEDLVIDTASLVTVLAEKAAPCVYTGACEIKRQDQVIESLALGDGTSITASHYILAAGAGNGELIERLNLPVAMQRRPLNQVIVKGSQLPEIYAHAVSLKSADKPRLTITTHQNESGTYWYLGGQLAESGVTRSDVEQIACARQELKKLLPWLDFSDCEFSCFRIDRAEPSQADQGRPDTPYAHTFGNISVCWPTKLTLAPMLGDMVMEQITINASASDRFENTEAPLVGLSPWDPADAG
jgi:glycerol-3-phosphate dehydrogenase